MAKAKTKFDPKDFLLKKGEFLVMGAAGFCLVVLLGWGASKWGSAKDPNEIANGLSQSANQLTQQIQTGAPTEQDLQAIQPPAFIVKPPINKAAKLADFPTQGPLFDPVAQPSTKRDNPMVFNVTDFQVDLTRSAMPGYDIIYNENNEPLIAVLASKTKSELDKTKLDGAAKMLKNLGTRGALVKKKLNQPQRQPQGPMGPGGKPGGLGGVGGPPGGSGFPPGGSGLPPGGDEMGGPGGSPYGLGGSSYDSGARRSDDGRVLVYVPLSDIDKSLAESKPPALTVIPVRLVTIHAVVPLKKQLEEIKRALRLPSPPPITNAKGEVVNQAEINAAEMEARRWGPWYDGFEIQRRESQWMSNGQERVIQEWGPLPKENSTEGNYKFEEKFIDKIDTRAIGYHYDEGFLPYFLKQEMMLSMPLPLLAPDLKVKYPEIRLKAIQDNIKKLEEANTPKQTQSDTFKKVSGSKTRVDLYRGRDNTAAVLGIGGSNFGGIQGPGSDGGPGIVGPRPGPGSGGPPTMPGPGLPGSGKGGPGIGGFGANDAPPVEVENYLLRFVDCDVQPGHTYQYRIRLRMLNPNYGQDKLVQNPEFAKENYRVLYSKWLDLNVPITVPAESFLYAFDTKTYREQTEERFSDNRELLKRLQLHDNQAVVQVATWMEQVRTDAGSKREPVGAWVVAEIPVERGQYVGRKQYVRLPLWSSESQPPQYVLREVAEKVVPPKGRAAPQPKGWLVDFSTRSILVDFEGGKVKNRFNVGFDDKGNLINRSRNVEEDVATELLIVRPDGKLLVRDSRVDEADENRKEIESKWTDWLRTVEAHKAVGGAPGAGDFNPFSPKGGK